MTTMNIALNHVDGMRFLAENEDGFHAVLDAGTKHGGKGQGVRPMEMLLMGLAGCMVIDVKLILAKSRQVVEDYRVEVAGTRRAEMPEIFTNIALHFTLSGQGLEATKVERALQLSLEKYCSAAVMLDKAAITFTFDIEEGS